jgi:hypothetical protein
MKNNNIFNQILRILVLASFIIIETFTCYSQTPTTNFSYDLNGNRIHRWVTIQKITEADSSFTMNQDSAENRNPGNIYNISNRVLLYPNPTQGMLDLMITGINDSEVAVITIRSITGQELLRQKTGLANTQINIGNFAPGTYFVNITLRTSHGTWEIVKY